MRFRCLCEALCGFMEGPGCLGVASGREVVREVVRVLLDVAWVENIEKRNEN